MGWSAVSRCGISDNTDFLYNFCGCLTFNARCLFQSSLEKSYRQTIHNLEDTSRRQEDMLKEMMQRLTNINTDPKSVSTEALDNRKYMLKSKKV